MESNRPIIPLPAGCPWSTYRPAQIKYCEENLCSWIVAPSNTWSNLGYILLGIWLWRKFVKEKVGPVFWFAAAAVATGVASFLYHASFSYFWQVFDYMGMYMFSGLIIALNCVRVGWIAPRKFPFLYLTLVVTAVLPFLLSGGVFGRLLFAAHIITGFSLEVFLYRKSKETSRPIDYRFYWTTIAIFFVSYAAWWVDAADVLCDPKDHIIQGHAVWHLVNAFCFLTMSKFYRQFEMH